MPQSRVSQIPLRLPVNVALEREDLIESPANATAIAMIDAWPDWPGRLTLLAGPVGCGKSHIAAVWAAMANAEICQSIDIAGQLDRLVELASHGTSMLVEDAGAGCVDDAVLFHLLNAVRESKGYCMITSRSWPGQWGVSLADLSSRLQAAQLIEIREPDDALLRQVIFKLFADRQLLVDPRVVDYCVLRMERSLGSATRLVEAIDTDAMASASGISRKVAARVLDVLENESPAISSMMENSANPETDKN